VEGQARRSPATFLTSEDGANAASAPALDDERSAEPLNARRTRGCSSWVAVLLSLEFSYQRGTGLAAQTNGQENFRAVAWRDGAVVLIDQTRLPHEEVWLTLRTPDEIAHAIRTMQVRGAPAIGVAGAAGVALAAHEWGAQDTRMLIMHIAMRAEELRATRPTAVNLGWAIDRMMRVARAAAPNGPAALRAALVAEVEVIADEDRAQSERIAAYGAPLMPTGGILTHCNTGALVTAGGDGTALAVIRAAWRQGTNLHVYADETRPRLQGARLTMWDLQRWGIPSTLIADGAAASLMRRGAIQAVIVGADRIAANGDTANKIGTYSAALAARAHGIPFYVAAPRSTFDCAISDGDAIEIEERAAEEVTEFGGIRVAPEGVAVANPAFDITPADLITAIITDAGILRSPYQEAIRVMADHEAIVSAAD
jgi:methylthioribose-1-phosphate isomerase